MMSFYTKQNSGVKVLMFG